MVFTKCTRPLKTSKNHNSKSYMVLCLYLCLLFAGVLGVWDFSLQFTNQYPLSMFTNTIEWIEYFSTNCSFIHQYYTINYPNLIITHIPCNESPQPYFRSIEKYNDYTSMMELYKTANGAKTNIYNIIVLNHSITHQSLSTYSSDARVLLYLIRTSDLKDKILKSQQECNAVDIRISQDNQKTTYFKIYSDESSTELSSLVSYGWVSSGFTSFTHCLLSYTYQIYIYCDECNVSVETQSNIEFRQCAPLTWDSFRLTQDDNTKTISFPSKAAAIGFVSVLLSETGFFNVEDIFVTTSLILSNFISSIFILIGMSMYYKIVYDNNKLGILLIMMFIVCGQYTIIIGFRMWLIDLYILQCLSQLDQENAEYILKYFTIILNSIFTLLWFGIAWKWKHMRCSWRILYTILPIISNWILIAVYVHTKIAYFSFSDVFVTAYIFAGNIYLLIIIYGCMVIIKQISTCCSCYYWLFNCRCRCSKTWILLDFIGVGLSLLIYATISSTILEDLNPLIPILVCISIISVPFTLITITSEVWLDVICLMFVYTSAGLELFDFTGLRKATDPSGSLFSSILIVLVIPFVIVRLFIKIKILNKFWINVVSIYLAVYDVVTDIVLIYSWIKLEHFTWAILQILFILCGQLVGAFGCYIDKENNKLKLSWFDKLMSLFGFGRAWLVIKSWSDTSENENYRKLYKKHKIYELMYESIPSVTLQIYVALISDQISISITQCIFATFVSMSWSVWIYLVGITRSLIYKRQDQNHDSLSSISGNNDNPTIELQTIANNAKPIHQCDSPLQSEKITNINPELKGQHVTEQIDSDDGNIKQNMNDVEKENDLGIEKQHSKKKILMRDCCKWLGCLHVVQNYKLFIHIYLFIFSDFVIRTFPLISFIAIINGNYGKYYSIITSCLLFGGLTIYEYFVNKWIRNFNQEKQFKTRFIILIFIISVLSSFYSLLSSLNILDQNKYLTKSVDKNKFMLSHLIRIVFSVVLYSTIISLYLYKLTEINNQELFETLIILCLICFIVNMINIFVLLWKM